MTMTEQTRPLDPRASGAPRDLNRLFAAGASANHPAHLRAYGDLDTAKSAAGALLAELEHAGLTGRGGAGFAVWRKVVATTDAASSRMIGSAPVVIGNGAEGEPHSRKDVTLLRNAPHLVIDGLLAAAAAVGASKLYLYVSGEAIEHVAAAIAERRDARGIQLVEAVDSFISGEASAVVNAIETGDARPRDRVRRLSDSGLKKRPTLVHNVETLAHIALIARFGAAWFRSAGTERDPGTRLVTVTGDVDREGVFEVAGDTPLREIVRAAGVSRAAILAVLVGGFHGTWVPADALELPLSRAGLSPVGGSPGAGVVRVLGRHQCGLAATATIVEYLAGESARQCGPCQFGLPALASRMSALAGGTGGRELVHDIRRASDTVVGRGSCHHPDGTARLVQSALAVFREDAQAHLSGRCTRSAGAR